MSREYREHINQIEMLPVIHEYRPGQSNMAIHTQFKGDSLE